MIHQEAATKFHGERVILIGDCRVLYRRLADRM
jgi:hypothetical protein